MEGGHAAADAAADSDAGVAAGAAAVGLAAAAAFASSAWFSGGGGWPARRPSWQKRARSWLCVYLCFGVCSVSD